MAPPTTGLFVRRWGAGEPVVLLHGSAPGDREAMWAGHRHALADRYRLLVPDRRGYGASPAGAPGDLDAEVADLLAVVGDGAHLVGFSYGGLLALLAAARRPGAIRSLAVIKPPVFAVARGHPAVDRVGAALADLYDAAPALAPEAFSRAFGRIWGDERAEPPPLAPERRRATARMMAERNPATVAVPLAALAAAPFPKLVLSGGWAAAFEIVCDTLAGGLGAERASVPGAGHGVRHPALVAHLAAFLDRASRPG